MPLGMLCPQYRRQWHLLFLGNQGSWRRVIFIPLLSTICQKSRNVSFENDKLIELISLPISFIYRITESQNVWDQKGTLDVILSKPPNKEIHLALLAQERVQTSFEHCKGWRLLNLPGQPLPGFSYLHGEKCFLMFKWNILCSRLCPLSLVL